VIGSAFHSVLADPITLTRSACALRPLPREARERFSGG
jgi:hypothetical protein